MTLFFLFYFIGFICFFAWICYDELKSFVGEHKAALFLGLVASLFWPLCLLIILGDFLEDFFGRLVTRRARRP